VLLLELVTIFFIAREVQMQTRLISYSQVRPGDFIGLDDMQELIAYCARVSNPANQMNSETSEKLIRYLIKHAHWSPLEMVNACLEIDTTRDIAHQIVRHRSFAFQEFSQRYADPKEMGEQFVLREARLQDTKNRQNSIEMNPDDATHRIISETWAEAQQEVIDLAKRTYEWAIDNGIAKEQARAVLPEGLTKTRLYMNGTIRSWIHYIELRGANGTQKEHMEIAHACAEVISEVFPLAGELYERD
jgi:thymidylate synthase (FAD)